MRKIVAVHALVNDFRERWGELEKILLGVTKAASFDPFLAAYRGHSHNRDIQEIAIADEELRSEIGSNLLSFFQQIFDVHQAKLELLSAPEFSQLLASFEEIINLSLYYWLGKEDQNFQFRTVMHFCDLEGVGDVIAAWRQDSTWVLSLTEYGVRLGVDSSEHLPKIAPISTALGLTDFSKSLIETEFADGEERSRRCIRALFARVRTVQIEIARLVDEWEHRNALLAVEFDWTQKTLQSPDRAENSAAIEEIGLKLGVHRDALACWCLQAFIALQRWLCELRSIPQLTADIVAEIEATDTLLLAAVQKIYLPASVSRHLFDKEVMRLLSLWSAVRLQDHPDDLSTLLHAAALKVGIDPEESELALPLDLLFGSSFKWKLSYDPCTPLKAFCWAYGPRVHAALWMAALVAIHKKTVPETLDDFWLGNIATLIQMPETFGASASVIEKRTEVMDMILEKLKSEIERIVASIGRTETNAEFLDYILERIGAF